MNSYPIRYQFSRSFDVPAKAAYQWCTDYRPDDWRRMGKKGTRRIKRLNEDTLILTDTVEGEGGAVTKKRLVRLNADSLAWTNTHLAGPNKHSQFWYQIVAVGKARSRLDFTGLQVNYGRRPSALRAAEAAKELKEDDSRAWVLLAREMSTDLRGKNHLILQG
jgi:transposase